MEIPERDPTAEFVTQEYSQWQKRLPDLAEIDKESLDAKSTEVLEAYWKRCRKNVFFEHYLPLWYRPGGDVWADDADWISLGKKMIQNGRTHPGVEVLLYFGQDEYHSLAEKILDDWLDAGGYDYEGFLDLIAMVYPHHERTREYIEDVEDYELQYASTIQLQTGYVPLLDSVAKYCYDEVESGDLDAAARSLILLGRELSLRSIPESDRTAIRRGLREFTRQNLANATKPIFAEESVLHMFHDTVLHCAASMQWTELAEELRNNLEYLHQLFFGEHLAEMMADRRIPKEVSISMLSLYANYFNDWITPLLAWSWLGPHEDFTGQLAAEGFGQRERLRKRMRNFKKSKQQSENELLAAAICWKRYRAATQ